MLNQYALNCGHIAYLTLEEYTKQTQEEFEAVTKASPQIPFYLHIFCKTCQSRQKIMQVNEVKQ